MAILGYWKNQSQKFDGFTIQYKFWYEQIIKLNTHFKFNLSLRSVL